MFFGRKFAQSDLRGDSSMSSSTYVAESTMEISEHANLVISSTQTVNHDLCLHLPVIDLDVPANLVPASRLGHSHLYINKPMTQEQMFKLLDVMVEVGIVEPGFYQSTRARGYSAVRLPWVKKTIVLPS